MVGQNHLGTVRDEEISVDGHARLAQRSHFLQKSHGIEHHAVADYAAAGGSQDSAGNQLQNEFLAIDDDRVPGIVAAGVAGHHRKALRQNVDNLSLALVAPLGSDNYRSLASFQCHLRDRDFADARPRHAHVRTPRGSHTLARGKYFKGLLGWKRSRRVRINLSRLRGEWERKPPPGNLNSPVR